jgi:diguanylate cyclase (GGDEF)-like protein
VNPELLEKVLTCERLPSLPTVAVKVIELTSDRNVRIADIAATISNDQGLAVKVLKTVNSSFYGLRQPCGSINQAIVMLGLSAVKTLALGFSLVSSLAESKDSGFDYPSYWARCLYTGVGAKCIASASRRGQPEDAFLGGLLQDIGMIALHRTLGQRYTTILAEANGEHRELLRHELKELEVSHADVGAMLASRWKFPRELVQVIKYHERPTAAPQDVADICLAVALGNIAADALASAEPGVALKRFYAKAEEWFGLNTQQIDQIMKSITQGTREVAHLLQVDVGTIPDVKELTTRADERLLSMTLPFGEPSDPNTQDAESDPLTGLPSRTVFTRNLVAGCERSQVGAGPLSVMLIQIDPLEAVRRTEGARFADALLISLSTLLRQQVARDGAMLCRFDEALLAVFMPGTDRVAATRAAEQLRVQTAAAPIKIHPAGLLPQYVPVTLSIGLATFDPAATGPARITSPEQLMDVTQRALGAARAAGGNALRVYTPRAAA